VKIEFYVKRADVVRKIIFRYHIVPCTDGVTSISVQKAMKDISEIIELNNFSNNVCSFHIYYLV
jgi:hypothetical protein